MVMTTLQEPSTEWKSAHKILQFSVIIHCHINRVQTGCAAVFTKVAFLIQLARKHPWAIWCWHPLFARASTVLAIVKEVQKITRLRGTIYFRGRAEWGQHGGSVVVSSQNDSWKGVRDGGKVGVGGGGGRLGVSGGGRRLGGIGIVSKEHHEGTEVWCVFLRKVAVRVCV